MKEQKNTGTECPGDMIAGRNAVLEALRAGRQMNAVYIRDAEAKGSLSVICAKAREAKVPVKFVSAQKLAELCGGIPHQGVVAACPAVDYAELSDILRAAQEKNQPPFIIICDEIEDPHNLGAIIRTAEAAGAHGVVIPKRRSAALTPTVYKTSAGAASVLPVCRTGNLSQLIERLKKEQVWVYCADMDGQPWCGIDYAGGVALVVGSEGKGVSRLIREQSDFTVSLPMSGQINSLNASVAAGIVMYEIARQRLSIQAK